MNEKEGKVDFSNQIAQITGSICGTCAGSSLAKHHVEQIDKVCDDTTIRPYEIKRFLWRPSRKYHQVHNEAFLDSYMKTYKLTFDHLIKTNFK